MTELMTYVRRGSRKANQGYAPLADAEALEDGAKENVSPLPVPGKKAASKARAASTEGDRRSSWIGRMLSYSSSAVTTANDKTGKKNAKVSEANRCRSQKASLLSSMSVQSLGLKSMVANKQSF